MDLKIRREFTLIDDMLEDCGQPASPRLRKAAIVTVVENPYPGKYVADLSEMIAASVPLGERMAQRIPGAIGDEEVQSYGKGGIVGLNGEQEHANALLTTAFANPFRDAIGGGNAWISSMTKVAAPGTPIDIPMNHKHDVYVRSHYDGMSMMLPGAPLPDEIAIIFCVASRGRINARVGGMTHGDAMSKLG
ncbi:amino acid synthesis family protein [Tepidamorphus sp. 3E244]|uniref:amino acid synthesis family protein n=1 Tax=Tepidamorphus sp. 3E244 TaxID=3385498 RepID=UPI0038FCF733